MVHTKVFKSNRSQAVRLPKPVAFPEDVKDVEIISVGQSRLITPANQAWDLWFEGPCVTNDFMSDRDQPGAQKRDAF